MNNRMNDRMKKLIDEVSDYDCPRSSIKIKDICLLLYPSFKEVDGAIILEIVEDGSMPEKLNMENIIRYDGNLSGYEGACNEIRLNDYIKYPKGNGRSVLKFALQLQKSWMAKIKIEYPDYKFCFILFYDGEFANLRFHRIRVNEIYLAEDLEDYEEEGVLVVEI